MTEKPRAWLDTETQSLGPNSRAYEVATIVRPAGGTRADDREHQWFVDIADLDMSNADPVSLRIGKFWARHPQAHLVPLVGSLSGDTREGLPETPPAGDPMREVDLLPIVADLTGGRAVICGSNPAFDMDVLGRRMRAHGILASWHYRGECLATAAKWWLKGRGLPVPELEKSEDLSRAVGVDPATFDRHTALGDCAWTRAIFDAINGPQPS